MTKKIKDNFITICIAILVTISLPAVINVFSSAYFTFVLRADRTSPNYALYSVLSISLAYSTILVIAYFLMKWQKADPLQEFNVRKDNINLKMILSSIATMVVIMTVISVLIVIFGDGGTSSATNTVQNDATRTLSVYSGIFPIFVTFLYPVIVGPIFEELIFRGFLGACFDINSDKTINKVLFVIFSAMIFGSLHFQPHGTMFTVVSSAVFPAISGVFYASIYLKNKNILSPIIAHSLYNFSIVIFSAWS